MPLFLNIETLANGPVELKGELSPEELDMETLDELVDTKESLAYSLTAERAGNNILLRGSLHMRLRCECARCLRSFDHSIDLTDWSCLLQLAGEEKIVLTGSSADLTPYLREDTFLAFPQHPLCEKGCGETPKRTSRGSRSLKIVEFNGESDEASVWAELDNLNLD